MVMGGHARGDYHEKCLCDECRETRAVLGDMMGKLGRIKNDLDGMLHRLNQEGFANPALSDAAYEVRETARVFYEKAESLYVTERDSTH